MLFDSTGDVLLFGLAKEQHAVTNPNFPFYLTVVGDDCAVGRTQGSIVGRRGLAGTVITYKVQLYNHRKRDVVLKAV